MSCSKQSLKCVCANKTGMVSEHWAMEQNEGFSFGIGRLAEVVKVSIWAEVADDGGAGWGVNGLGLGGEQFADQSGDFSGPFRLVLAARQTGRPGLGVALSAGAPVVRAQLVEATEADLQFERDGFRRKNAGATLGEEMADQWDGNTVGEVDFFLARKPAGRWI